MLESLKYNFKAKIMARTVKLRSYKIALIYTYPRFYGKTELS